MATHAETLEALIAVGAALARSIGAAHDAGDISPTEAADAFERVSRATRRTILLAARPAEAPAAAAADAAQKAGRRAVIRAVEDAITREPRLDAPARAAIEAEFHERLDAPELAEDLAARPAAEIVADILHDLDLGRPLFSTAPHWRRRGPEAIRRLHARAAGQPAPDGGPSLGPAPEPEPTPQDDRQDHVRSLRQLHADILAAVASPPPPPPH